MSLAAGEGFGATVEKVVHATEGGDFREALLGLGTRAGFQAEADISGDAHVGKEEVVLKDHGDAAETEGAIDMFAGVKDGFAIESDEALVGRFEAGDHADEGSLACA